MQPSNFIYRLIALWAALVAFVTNQDREMATSMKTLRIASVYTLAFISPSFGASVTVPDTSTALPGVAAATLALLVDTGSTIQKIGSSNFIVEVKNFHCDQYSRGSFDASDRLAGLSTIKCRIEARNLKDTHTGRPFVDSRSMNDLLQRIQDTSVNGKVHFSDCAMGGYCGTFVKSITCTINTAIQNFNNGGRWTCTFVDGQ
jgi:hypothetical protein